MAGQDWGTTLLMSTLIDLSRTIRYEKGDPWFMRIKLKHSSHKKGRLLIRYLGLPFKLFPKGFIAWADDRIERMGVHSSTHLDAPWHYHHTVEGKAAKTIDQVPLDWCFGDGIVIDMSHKADFDPITIADLQTALTKTGSVIKPGTIVLIRTDRDRLAGSWDYFARGTGMSAAATLWLLEQGVKVTGIDQWGWDLPLKTQVSQAKQSKNGEGFWEAHRVGIDHEYCHIEQLTNLAALPPHGFKLCVFPLKIEGASAGPARVVAILD